MNALMALMLMGNTLLHYNWQWENDVTVVNDEDNKYMVDANAPAIAANGSFVSIGYYDDDVYTIYAAEATDEPSPTDFETYPEKCRDTSRISEADWGGLGCLPSPGFLRVQYSAELES